MSLSYLQSESSNLEGVQGFPKIPNMCSGITFTPNTHLLAMRGQWLCLQMVMWVRKASRLVGGRLNPWDLGRERAAGGLVCNSRRKGREETLDTQQCLLVDVMCQALCLAVEPQAKTQWLLHLQDLSGMKWGTDR